jgi:hypothetical protein
MRLRQRTPVTESPSDGSSCDRDSRPARACGSLSHCQARPGHREPFPAVLVRREHSGLVQATLSRLGRAGRTVNLNLQVFPLVKWT